MTSRRLYSSRKNSIVLTPNMAALSRGANQELVRSHGTITRDTYTKGNAFYRGAWLPWRPLVKINRQKLGLFHGGSPWTSSTKRSMDRGSMCCIRPIIDMLRKFAVKQSEEARSIPVFSVFAVKFMNIDMHVIEARHSRRRSLCDFFPFFWSWK